MFSINNYRNIAICWFDSNPFDKKNNMKNLLIISLVCVLMFSCKPEFEEDKTSNLEILNDSVVQKNVDLSTKQTKPVEVRYWSSSETKLPVGEVYKYDCAGMKTSNQNIKDNYVTIKRPNGFLTIVKDIDDDLFLNIEIGDRIE